MILGKKQFKELCKLLKTYEGKLIRHGGYRLIVKDTIIELKYYFCKDEINWVYNSNSTHIMLREFVWNISQDLKKFDKPDNIN